MKKRQRTRIHIANNVPTCDDATDDDDDQHHIFDSISTNKNPFEIELYSFEKVHIIIFGIRFPFAHQPITVHVYNVNVLCTQHYIHGQRQNREDTSSLRCVISQ